ncbi:hypothetical protein N8T08_000495 [Aspergillus melleus]|uniref:Uncharacterized protein n=1 Tax=Aspergillus melleus TaxID=138277 RepID=A0ACC3BCL9_9EURO|nr:hypothetical protein N8T08_000495 [Aspergillus melleus]
MTPKSPPPVSPRRPPPPVLKHLRLINLRYLLLYLHHRIFTFIVFKALGVTDLVTRERTLLQSLKTHSLAVATYSRLDGRLAGEDSPAVASHLDRGVDVEGSAHFVVMGLCILAPGRVSAV